MARQIYISGDDENDRSAFDEQRQDGRENDKTRERENKNFNSDNGEERMRFRWFVCVAFAITFLMSAIVLGVMYTNESADKNMYVNALENSYNRAVYDLVDNVNAIELNLNKAYVSASAALQKKYLILVCDNCKYAQSNLSLLPANISSTREGVKFINQVDGYCSTLVWSEQSMNSEQKAKVQELNDIAVQFKVVLNALIEKVMQGYSILNGSADANLGIDDFSSNFDGLSSDSINYPSMIFDGPFSDSLDNREILFLSNNEVTSEQAKQKLETILDTALDVDSVVYEGATSAKFDTYDFSINLTSGQRLFAQMTKRDGFLITLTGQYEESEQAQYSLNDCIAIAKEFLSANNILDMECVWSEELEGVAVLNMAPVIDDIIMYPDLIKVKIEMQEGQIIGYEAQNYAYNHINRTNLTAAVGATEARELIDQTINVNTQKLCVIPLEYGGEVLAYEFNAEKNGYTYYIYINAKNGNEERVMQVVSTDDGNLMM